MSAPHREMLDGLLDDLYDQVCDGIATTRKQGKERIQRLIDQGIFLAREALAEGLVDYVGYKDEILELLNEQLGDLHLIETVQYRHRRTYELRQ